MICPGLGVHKECALIAGGACDAHIRWIAAGNRVYFPPISVMRVDPCQR